MQFSFNEPFYSLLFNLNVGNKPINPIERETNPAFLCHVKVFSFGSRAECDFFKSFVRVLTASVLQLNGWIFILNEPKAVSKI